ncbi:MAG: hypothetical protein GY765_28050 [bacterium]|nr:hypothetical protein [bacterium]
MNTKYKITLVFLIICFSLWNCTAKPIAPEKRPNTWAQAIEKKGLPNLHKVSDTLYRGAQPKKVGFAELKKMGIKTIVNLRSSDKDLKYTQEHGFNYHHIPVNTFSPKTEQFARFMEIVTHPDSQPVFLHCKHGADRTGSAVAIYRIKIQNWDTEEAIKEMVQGGFNFHTMHNRLKEFVRKFVTEKK